MQLTSLCLIFFISAWQVVAVYTELTGTRYRPCAGPLYFNKVSEKQWGGVIDLGFYSNYDQVVIGLKFKNAVSLNNLPSTPQEVVIGSKELREISLQRPIPQQIQFSVTVKDGVLALFEFSINQAVLCNDEIKATLKTSEDYYNNATGSGQGNSQCGKRFIDNEEWSTPWSDARPGDWPWHVGIYASGQFRVTGSILSKTAVITAYYTYVMNNVGVYQVSVTAGATDVYNYAQPGVQTRIAKQILKLPTNDRGNAIYSVSSYPNLSYDLVIIKVDEFQWTQYVRPICLYMGAQNGYIGAEGTIVGYSSGNVLPLNPVQRLKSTVTQIQNDGGCINTYAAHNGISFCVGATNIVDIGGGVAVSAARPDQSFTWYLRGIGYRCRAYAGQPCIASIPTRLVIDIVPYQSWIVANAGL